MKVKIAYTVEVDTEQARRCFQEYYGRKLSTSEVRKAIVDFCRGAGEDTFIQDVYPLGEDKP